MNATVLTPADAAPEHSLRDYLATLSRRWRQVALVVAVAAALTLLLALLWPATYQATGTILIEQQEVPQDLVRTTITSYADERVQTISQRVMTTQNLLDLIKRYDLYPRERRTRSREEIIERMRKDVVFKLISANVVDPRSGVPREATIAFSVAYRSRSADLAYKVANELSTLYLNENLTERTRLASEASGFLKEESDRLAQRVAGLESQLADFRSRHADALPELTPINMQFLEHADQEMRDLQSRQWALEQQRAFLSAQLSQIKPDSVMVGEDGERILTRADRLKSLRTQLASAQALYSPGHPDILRLKRELAGLEAQEGAPASTNDLLRELEVARGELGEAQKKYSAAHPDVQRLQRRVAALQAELAAQADSPAARPPAAAPETLAGPENPDNPAYVQIRSQLNAASTELNALQEQQRALRSRAAGYERKITVPPQVEREYRQLTRDYETEKLKYQEVLSKQMEAQVAQNLETDRKGERFTLIDPPLPPEEPASPNRKAMIVIGLMLSLALGAAAASLLESVDQTVRGRSDVVELLLAPPLAIVPRIVTNSEIQAWRRRKVMALWTGVAALALFVILFHLFVRPLDVMWFQGLRHLGV